MIKSMRMLFGIGMFGMRLLMNDFVEIRGNDGVLLK